MGWKKSIDKAPQKDPNLLQQSDAAVVRPDPQRRQGRLSIATSGRGEAEGQHRKSFPKVGRHR